MRVRSFALPAVLALASEYQLTADVVVLVSGTIKEGTVRSIDDQKLVLKEGSASTVIARKQILNILLGIGRAEYDAQSARGGSPKSTPPRDAIDFGKEFRSDRFSLALTGAEVGYPKVKDMFGDFKQGQSEQLILTMQLSNTHDRKILRYKEGNMFLDGYFHLQDDVDNDIRGVSFGMGSTIEGALTGSEDINPGEDVTHVEVFRLPPKKTQFLLLSVNLEAFGGEGSVCFKLPIEQVVGFAPTNP
jgi:hypothetical protein